ncbi:T9SS type A sorting domain-containing protein [Emticicia sp. C21]|uniref:T9SS type A sorting domain-containing protein n=1 Tax=Emticicia sp. C21 TaxID=2302915 RepID=UPI000E348343|nr:T9SS type A sorting domain-containing protein [Emticicia sp. C21]RFS17456.1 T9SS C-terminal target domain-containing protein [Emticicia sp. C21]
MTKIVYATFLLLLSYYYSYAQEQTPAIEWVEPYNGGTKGGSITLSPGPNTLFALIKDQNTNSGSASISKFHADGLVKNQYITVEGGSGNVPYMLQCPSQDGGVLAYLTSSHVFKKYDASLNLSWELTDIYFYVQTATATLANGFYLQGYSFTNNKPVTELKRMRNDGTIEWSVDISGFSSSTVNDIQTSSDDGVIIASASGIRKYNALGNLIWSNTDILGASQLIITDPSIMYTYTNSSNSGNRSIIQLNTSTGNANWTRLLIGENINDFERTSDNGCVFSTNTGLYKYNSAGGLQWKNTNYSSAKITTTGDGKIFIIKNNAIIKLNFSNEQLWSKSFNSNYYVIQDINGASDFGLYVTAVKNGIYYNTGPSFLLFKLASPDTPCKTNFDITGENATFCRNGSLSLSSKMGNVSMEYMAYLTNLSFQWYKNNAPIQFATNYYYTAFQTGNYTLKVRQQGCEATSRQVELNIVNSSAPIIEADTRQICAGTPLSLRTRGCEGTVVWSTGARGEQIDVTPQVTTTYNAWCETTVNNELCQSYTSNYFTVSVRAFSNLKISDIAGKREFCPNDSTELKPTLTGGIPPFSYTWIKNSSIVSKKVNPLIGEEGDYILHVFDNVGCYNHSDIIHIKKADNPVPPVINPPTNTILCLDGHITLSTNNQESGYQWIINSHEIKDEVNPSYNVTVPGSYLLKVKNASGCSSISNDAVVITPSDLSIKDVVGRKELCKGSSTQLEATILGGVEPYNYVWTKNDTIQSQNNNAIIKQKGEYIFTVIDKVGCKRSSQPILIKELSIPIAPVISSSLGTHICVDSKSILTTDSKAVSYQWYLNDAAIEGASNQFYTAASSGKYALKVTNENNCSNISENAITISQIIIPQPTIKQSNDSLISSASAGNKWYFNTTELPLTSQKIKFTEVGNYQVKVFEKGCESIISANFIPIILANEEMSIHIQLYPNPTSDKVFIKSSKAFSYQLVDVMGRSLKQSTDKSFSHTIDIKGFTSGNYFVILQEENGSNFVRKLSVNQ